jgi:hypothetical protein
MTSKLLTDEPLRVALGVHLGGVHKGHADVEAEPQRGDLLPPALAHLGHVPGALPEHGDRLPGGQGDVPHHRNDHCGAS